MHRLSLYAHLCLLSIPCLIRLPLNLPRHPPVHQVRFSGDCAVAVSAGYDKAVKVWDCRSRNYHAIQSMSPFADSVTSIVVRATDIFASSVDGTVRRFDVRMGALITDQVQQPVPLASFPCCPLFPSPPFFDNRSPSVQIAGGM